jgi:hypothetical protein
MFRSLNRSSLAVLAVLSTLAGFSFASGGAAPIVPKKNGKIAFARTYTKDYLKNHPLQMVTKTSLVLKNTKGLLTAEWNATIRDIRTDELVDLSATGICKARSARTIDCNYDASTGTVELFAQPDGVFLSIPVGQGVLLSHEKDGIVRSELLLGADESNNAYRLYRK